MEISSFNDFWKKLDSILSENKYGEHFDEPINYLMNNIGLKVGENIYQIIECEIYCHDPENHADPFVHRRKHQQLTKKWYFNDGGLDITFGNNEIYASIIIRGIKNISEKDNAKKYTSGPLNVVRELFDKFGDVDASHNTLYLFEYKFPEPMTPIKSTRVGLSTINPDPENFIDKYYRYLIDTSPVEHKYKEKEKVKKNNS